MKRAILPPLAVLAAAVLFAVAAIADHIELPQELQEGLPQLPDGSTPQPAGHEADIHSDNMILVANFNDQGRYRQGTDLAFWGKDPGLRLGRHPDGGAGLRGAGGRHRPDRRGPGV